MAVEIGVEVVHCVDFSEWAVPMPRPVESGPVSPTIATRTTRARIASQMHGLHLIADLQACHGVTPLDDADGRPQGVTGVVLLVESHLAVHTWPELRGVTADVYVCNVGADNSARAEAVLAQLVAAFGPREPRVQRVQRG